MHDSLGLLGTVIAGKYRVDAVAGEGGFGIVYRGHHLGFDHAIGIKCLKVPSHFTADARRTFMDRFAEEGKLLFRLSEHRSIVRVFDHGVIAVGGQPIPYLILEWLIGESLSDHLAKRRVQQLPPMPEAEALRLLREPVDALAFAHQLRVAHRDIKPANLFLARSSSSWATRLLDFGVAKLMQEADEATQYTAHTSSGFQAFSPEYGAPEQFYSKGFGQTGPWTDVHAIGLLLTELVTGRSAYEGRQYGDYHARGTDEARPTPRAKGANVSQGFELICATALAREPRNRFRSAQDLCAAIDAHLASGEANRVAPAPPVSPAPYALATTAPPTGFPPAPTGPLAYHAMPPPTPPYTPPPFPGSTQPIAPSRTPRIVVGVAVLGVAAVVAIAATATHSTTPPPAPVAKGSAASPLAPAALVDAAAPAAPVETLTHVLGADGAVFEIGDAVFVRPPDAAATQLAKGHVDALAPDHARVDGKPVQLDDLTPGKALDAKWVTSTIVLVAASDAETAYVGRVTGLQDAAATVEFWDGKGVQHAQFSTRDADKWSRPVRVRDAWQAPLAVALAAHIPTGAAPVALRTTSGPPAPTPHAPAPVRPVPHPTADPSCDDYCINVAQQARGTTGFNACLAGCK